MKGVYLFFIVLLFTNEHHASCETIVGSTILNERLDRIESLLKAQTNRIQTLEDTISTLKLDKRICQNEISFLKAVILSKTEKKSQAKSDDSGIFKIQDSDVEPEQRFSSGLSDKGRYVSNSQMDRIEAILRDQIDLQNAEINDLRQEVSTVRKRQVTCQNDIRMLQETITKEQINSGHYEDTAEQNGKVGANLDKLKHRRLLVGDIMTTEKPVTKKTTAFYAYMNKNEGNPSRYHSLIFDVVKTNTNGGYSPFSGMFTAPDDGVYVFAFSIRVKCKSYGAYELVKNASVQNVIIYSDTPVSCLEDHATGITVIAVNQGDEIFVRTHSALSHTGDIYSDANGYSSFSGWQISN